MRLRLKYLKLASLLIFCCAPFTNAQFNFIFNDSILVIKEGEKLQFPWAGGLNHPQFSSIDVDFDGWEDLFIFDRSKNLIQVFKTIEENGIKKYEYLYDSRSLFPEDIRYRAAMIDYNQDGKKDLFTYGLGGIKVYKNIGNATDGLRWEVVTEQLLSTYNNGNKSNLYVSSSDLPAYVDVDGDGDIDILTFHLGGQYVEYHKNLSIEHYGIPDSLEFELYNECWGKFNEGYADNGIVLNSTLGPCGDSNLPDPQRNARHSGSTILALDLNQDNVMDLILGDVSHNNLTALINGGTVPNQNSPMISKDDNYPSNTTPVDITIFPSSFFLDVNHDGLKDLIVSTNAENNSENFNNVWYYQNKGTADLPQFSFVQKNFLQDQMIENGMGAIPILVDLNNDGLKDLLISSYFKYLPSSIKSSKIQYYQNTGTLETPEFTLISDDWMSLSSQGYGLKMHPTFGDITGSGQNQMILGAENGKLYFYTRTGDGAEDFSLNQMELKDHLGAVIDVNKYAAPYLFDLNNDGLLDLIIGKKGVGITYYENIGTTTNPSFKWITDHLGQIDMGDMYAPDNYATPQFIRHNDTLHLFTGNRKGTLFYYNEIEGNIHDGGVFNLVSDHYANINTGGYSAPFIDTLRKDGRYEMFVGTELGGVWAYIDGEPNTPVVSISQIEKVNQNLNIYPNPSTTGLFTISSNFDKKLDISIYNTVGQGIKQIQSFSGKTYLDLSSYHQGVYFVIFKYKDQMIATQRIITQH